ncbi:uncharacterized protein ACNLHF_017530 isoform 2-T2 [Anomaloglossus baeobatrachus]|uniref:uncharacterized protein LOC142296261 isoform X2 n=1 Tax=Anomaloglossus baeobatrachus TaxID=238106 RepID=UPI003F4FDF79
MKTWRRICNLISAYSKKTVKVARGPVAKAIVCDSSTETTEDVCEIVYLGKETTSSDMENREAALLLQHKGSPYQMQYTLKTDGQASTKLEKVHEIEDIKNLENYLSAHSFIQNFIGNEKYTFQCKAQQELFLCVKSENGGNEIQLSEPGQKNEHVFHISSAGKEKKSNKGKSAIIPAMHFEPELQQKRTRQRSKSATSGKEKKSNKGKKALIQNKSFEPELQQTRTPLRSETSGKEKKSNKGKKALIQNKSFESELQQTRTRQRSKTETSGKEKKSNKGKKALIQNKSFEPELQQTRTRQRSKTETSDCASKTTLRSIWKNYFKTMILEISYFRKIIMIF